MRGFHLGPANLLEAVQELAGDGQTRGEDFAVQRIGVIDRLAIGAAERDVGQQTVPIGVDQMMTAPAMNPRRSIAR